MSSVALVELVTSCVWPTVLLAPPVGPATPVMRPESSAGPAVAVNPPERVFWCAWVSLLVLLCECVCDASGCASPTLIHFATARISSIVLFMGPIREGPLRWIGGDLTHPSCGDALSNTAIDGSFALM